MIHLLDVNVLVAWGWSDHADHGRVARWIASTRGVRNGRLLTSAIPELGFVRISVQRTGGRVSPDEASETLAGMLLSLGVRHVFLPDDRAASAWPPWCRGASRTTDAHLLALAHAHGARLTTLDTGIPDAWVIPVTSDA